MIILPIPVVGAEAEVKTVMAAAEAEFINNGKKIL